MGWNGEESEELYGVRHWGADLFRISDEGNLIVMPAGPGNGDVDLAHLSEQLEEQGIALPVLVRMPQIAERRLQLMSGVFNDAISEYGYEGVYRPVYPIKVNQQRQLVEEILRAGASNPVGLEAGSKAELLLAIAMLDAPGSLVICNGYKDRRYLEMAIMARRLGRDTIIVVEKLSEVQDIIECSQKLGIRPSIGVRAKLSKPGRGKWQLSSGDRAKFGLSVAGIVSLVEQLRDADMLDCLRLLHFHIGSQVTAIQTFKRAFREASRIYVELSRLGAPLGLLDVGGGLGVDYDGSRTRYDSSRNYTEREYAHDLVYAVSDACTQAGIPHPDLVTESGRATVAHCSVLLFDILGVESRHDESVPVSDAPESDHHELYRDLCEVFEGVDARNCQEAWHDAQDLRLRSSQLFDAGDLRLDELAEIERVFWQVSSKLQRVVSTLRYVPPEFATLDDLLADTYYANFSVFQSAPDSWAIDQVFPCLPIQRLHERPDRRAVIADLTCDSDGKLSKFIDRRTVKNTLEVHTLRRGEKYRMALALVGAYQEILGDMHNLFGTTNAVHVSTDSKRRVVFDRVIDGETVQAVAGYVQYDRGTLIDLVRQSVERAINQEDMTRSEGRELLARYRDGLDGYTYLHR